MLGTPAERNARVNPTTIEDEAHRRSLPVMVIRSGSSESVLKLSVPDVDPLLSLVAEARLRLVSTADDTVLFERTYVRHSRRDTKFVEWARDAAAEFRSARDEALDDLAHDVVAELAGVERETAPSSQEPMSEPTNQGADR